MYRMFAVFIALFGLWKAPECFHSRSVAVRNLEQNVSNVVIEIFFKLELGIDLYGSNYLKVNFYRKPNFYRKTNTDLTT